MSVLRTFFCHRERESCIKKAHEAVFFNSPDPSLFSQRRKSKTKYILTLCFKNTVKLWAYKNNSNIFIQPLKLFCFLS